ncbi:MAG: hypothetical protein JW889_06570 [Verrucomicrobia bacterium]|nr:hypothetical protein [Verrucomicrobiota bacterium]
MVDVYDKGANKSGAITATVLGGRVCVALFESSRGDSELLADGAAASAMAQALREAASRVAMSQGHERQKGRPGRETLKVIVMYDPDVGGAAHGIVSVSSRGVGICLNTFDKEGVADSFELWLSPEDAARVAEALQDAAARLPEGSP